MTEDSTGGIYFQIRLDNDKLRADAAESQKIIKGVGSTVVSEGAKLNAFEQGFNRAKIELDALGTSAMKSGSGVNKFFHDLFQSISHQKGIIRDLEKDFKEFNKQLDATAPGQVKQGLMKGSAALRAELDAERGALAALEEAAKKMNSGYADLTRQLRFLQAEMIRLEQAGQRDTTQFRELEAEASRLSNSISGIQKTVRDAANSGAAFKGLSEGIRAVSGAFAAGSGVMALFAGENENLQRIQVRLQSAMAIIIGLQELSNTLDKNSTFSTVTLSAAKTAYTAVLTRLTAALGGSAIAAKALMGTLTLGLSVAIGAAVAAWDRYTAKQEEANKKLQERFDLERDAREIMYKTQLAIDAQVESIRKFNGTKDQEKKKVKELNESYGETFGYFKTLDQWYNTLISKGGAYVQSLYLQAKAQALLSKSIDAEVKAQEAQDTPTANYSDFGKRVGMRLRGKSITPEQQAAQSKKEAVLIAKTEAKAYRDQWEATMAELEKLNSSFDFGGYSDLSKGGGSKTKADDPFLRLLENRKKQYEEYARWISSTDGDVNANAGKQFEKLLTEGGNWLEYLQKTRTSLQTKLMDSPDNKEYIKQLAAVRNQLAEEQGSTIMGGYEATINNILNATQASVKDKLAELERMRNSISEDNPLKAEKVKILDTESDKLNADLVKQQREDLQKLLQEHIGFIEQRLRLEELLNSDLAALEAKRAKATTEADKNALTAVIANRRKAYNSDLSKIIEEQGKSELKTILKVSEANEKAISAKRFKWEADRQKALLEAKKEGFEKEIEYYEKIQAVAPTEENAQKIEELKRKIAELNGELEKIPQQKLHELVDGLQGVLGALSGMDNEIGKIASAISKNLDGIVESFQNAKKRTKDYAGSISSAMSGVVDLINMATSASKKRKQAERDHMLEQIAFAREYALALTDQLRLQGELSGGGFVRDYSAEINSAYESMTQAQTKLNEAMSKLAEGRAKTDRKDVVDGSAVANGAITGVAIGASIGSIVPVIGTAIGAVVGGVVGGIVGLFSKKSKDLFSGLLPVYPDLIDANGDLNTSLAETLIATNQVDDKTKELLTDTIEWQKAVDESRAAITDIVMELAGDLGNSIHDALKEAFEAGEDAGTRMFDALNQSLGNLIDNLIYGLTFAKSFEQFQTKLEAAIASANPVEASADAYDWLYEQLEKDKKIYNEQKKLAQGIAAERGLSLWDGSSGDARSGTSKGIASLTQDQGNELNDRFTAIQGHTFSSMNSLLEIKIDMAAVHANTAAQLRHLANIDTNTSRLEAIENSMARMSVNIETIVDRGVKML